MRVHPVHVWSPQPPCCPRRPWRRILIWRCPLQCTCMGTLASNNHVRMARKRTTRCSRSFWKLLETNKSLAGAQQYDDDSATTSQLHIRRDVQVCVQWRGIQTSSGAASKRGVQARHASSSTRELAPRCEGPVDGTYRWAVLNAALNSFQADRRPAVCASPCSPSDCSKYSAPHFPSCKQSYMASITPGLSR